jgi:hypothetical protein
VIPPEGAAVVAAVVPEGAELSLGVAALAVEPEAVFVAEPEVVFVAAVLVAEPRVFAPVSVAGPEAVSVTAESAVVPVFPVSAAGFAIHQVSGNIAVASVVANPASLGVTWADSP